MGLYQAGLGLAISPRKISSLYNQGVQVGLVSGGYFKTELAGLNSEIEQMDVAQGQARGLDREGRLRPITDEQEIWFNAVWAPFFRGWKQFYGEYAFGWKSIRFPIATSRLEQLEDYRKRFIAIRNQVGKVFPDNSAIANLPPPTAPKRYTSWWDDLIDAIGGMFKSTIIWVLVAVAGVALIYVFVKRVGGPGPMPLRLGRAGKP